MAPLEDQLLSPAAIKLAVDEIRRLSRQSSETSTNPPELAAKIARLDRQIEQLSTMLKDGTLAPTIAGVALQKAHEERADALAARQHKGEIEVEKIVRILPKAAQGYLAQVRAIRQGHAEEAVIHRSRAVLSALFGGVVRLVPADTGDHLIAEVALSRTALVQAAGGRVSNGSGGRI